jgi:hypothetical protein
LAGKVDEDMYEEEEDDAAPIEEASAMEEEEIWTDQANNPLDLARKVWKTMEMFQTEEPEMFLLYRVVAQNLLDFLWAANNNLTSGIRLRSTEGDLEAMKHTRECLHEFLTFAEEGTIPEWSRYQEPGSHCGRATATNQQSGDEDCKSETKESATIPER